MIRVAELADTDAIVEMTRKFYKFTQYPKHYRFDDETVTDYTQQMIEDHAVLVVELEGNVIGIVACEITPFRFNRNKLVAMESIFWLEAAAQSQGYGRKLLKLIAPMCKHKGANTIIMVHLADSPPQAAALYMAEGYMPSENCYTKEI